MGQIINVTISDYSKASICSTTHEYIQITDGNKESRTFDVCGKGTKSAKNYVTKTHRIEIIFSNHYDVGENTEHSVFLLHYSGKSLLLRSN